MEGGAIVSDFGAGDKYEGAPLPLLDHPPGEVAAFTARGLLDAVKTNRGLTHTRVPRVCVLEFDGDLSDKLTRKGIARPYEPWACFHTTMTCFGVPDLPGEVGLVARTIGGPYAVLIAEQMFASGAEIVLGLTSAGRVARLMPLPNLVIVDEAIRDEGTSYHYLAPSRTVRGDPALVEALAQELRSIDLPSRRGLVWTTDAPYRETRERLAVHEEESALAVEMQAASLFALAEARGFRVGVVAHVTNAVVAESADQHGYEPFHKGHPDLDEEILFAMCRAAQRCLERTNI
jgi:nucleoside phosphorylase